MREWEQDGEVEDGRRKDSFICFSQPWWQDRLGNPQCLTTPPPTRDNLSGCHTHTHTLLQSVDIHTCMLIPTPPSVSLHRIILHPHTHAHTHMPSLSKKIFPRVWNAGGHLGGAGKRSRRWCTHADQWDPNIPELSRHKDSTCRRRHPPFPDDYSSFSLPPAQSGPVWADRSVSQYGEFTHHWPFQHCCCCLLPPFSLRSG